MSSMEPSWRWLVEWTSPGEGFARCVKRVYYSGRTGYQDVDVVELCGLGKALVIDGKVQSSISDEHWYHEALVHPPLLAHECPRRVLVLGGGEGATVREVLRHRCVERVVMVDLDSSVVELAEKYLWEWHQGSLRDPRVELVFMDGRRFVEETSERFDAAILDLVDPLPESPAAMLYTVEFYEALASRLSEGGVVVTQATSPTYTLQVYAAIKNTLAEVFEKTSPYMTFVRSYNGLWGFVAASNTRVPGELGRGEIARLIEERIEGGQAVLRFYSPETHEWMFTLPLPVKKALEETRTVSRDSNPVHVPI